MLNILLIIQNYFFIPCCRRQSVYKFTFGDCNGSGDHSIVYCFIPSGIHQDVSVKVPGL